MISNAEHKHTQYHNTQYTPREDQPLHKAQREPDPILHPLLPPLLLPRRLVPLIDIPFRHGRVVRKHLLPHEEERDDCGDTASGGEEHGGVVAHASRRREDEEGRVERILADGGGVAGAGEVADVWARLEHGESDVLAITTDTRLRRDAVEGDNQADQGYTDDTRMGVR